MTDRKKEVALYTNRYENLIQARLTKQLINGKGSAGAKKR